MSTLLLRFTGRVADLGVADRRALLDRAGSLPPIEAEVAALVADTRARGDQALLDQAERFDGGRPACLEVSPREIQAAADRLDPVLRKALDRAASALARAHEAQRPRTVEVETEPGVRVGRRPDPLRRAGIYAPGGRSPYPSSVLMGAVPARVAGIAEVILCSPAKGGAVHPLVLAAAAVAGVDRVFAAGGAGAIAAMAYGTATIPPVERIVGPGNAWVAEAKRQVQRQVPIDSPAGPSELLIVAGRNANPQAVARELLAQAEHDPQAAAVALVEGETLGARVIAELESRVPRCDRADVVRASLAGAGGVLVLDSVDQGLALSESYAPEHLLLCTENPREDLDRVRAAGAVFLGERSSVVFGDYLAGSNHVLPTAGAARAWSGLSVLDFVRFTSFVEVTAEGAAALSADSALLARAEGLDAHAAAARAWGSP